jgi:serine/threonine protein kinase
MMMGHPPLEAAKRRENDPLADMLLRKSADYSDKLMELVEWCMTLDPMGRPQSANDLLTALVEY